MTDLVRVSQLVFNRPHHITPQAGEAIANVLRERILQGRIDDTQQPAPAQDGFIGKPARDRDNRYLGYRTEGSAAIIDMRGELVNRGTWLGSSSGLVSYEGLRKTLNTVAKESSVRSIVFDVDSPGGEATGMIETSDLVRQIATRKPVFAVANGLMCSAAYGVCSGATKILVSRTSMVGSIGTIMMHIDRTDQLAQMGIKVTVFKAGAEKADLSALTPMSDETRAKYEGEINKLNDMFVAAVAEGRGITEASVRATEARVYFGQDAVDAGLADAVGDFEMALGDARRASINYQNPKVEVRMTNPTGHGREYEFAAVMEDAAAAMRQAIGAPQQQATPTTPAPAPVAVAPAVPAAASTPAASPSPSADSDAAYQSGFEAGVERVRQILQSEEAKTRPAQAQVLALETSMPAADATKVLAMMPDDAKAAATGGDMSLRANRTTKMYEAIAANGGDARVPHQGGAGETLEADNTRSSTLRNRMGTLVDQRTRHSTNAKEAAR